MSVRLSRSGRVRTMACSHRDAEKANRALDLRVSEQELDCAQVAGSLVIRHGLRFAAVSVC